MSFAFVLTLFLAATLPVLARPALLTIGSLPPDIVAYDSAGKAHRLHALRKKSRIVLLTKESTAYLDTVRRHQAQFTERDLVVLMTDWPSSQFYLVGKDGHIKMARHVPPANKELFAVIDAMPMRQAEMQERKRP